MPPGQTVSGQSLQGGALLAEGAPGLVEQSVKAHSGLDTAAILPAWLHSAWPLTLTLRVWVLQGKDRA